ncbi:MAG: Cof-type HAD-IIB family hydrolase [Mediterranea massiliensis]|nr:Cof-type HAD-IIB family hydrolase [Mediterranea massiliensis]
MIKALFFDIDGTLVSFHTHRIPASTIQALKEAKARGVKLFIATGRPQVIINNLQALQQQGLIDGYITMNGAYCFVEDEVIYKSPIPKSDIETLLNFCEAQGKACIVVGEKDICVYNEDEEVRFIFYETLSVDKIREVTREEALAMPDIYQITPFINQEEEALIKPQLPHCEIGRWYPTFADITASGNTKQRGIDEIIHHFGLKIDEVMAFGDGGNDIPMLRHAGIGVAMGNATDEVKAAANYTTTAVDEDGILNALVHFGVIEHV